MILRKLVTNNWVHVSPSSRVYLFQGWREGEGEGWVALKLHVPFWRDFCWEIQMWKNGVTIEKRNSL